ncbi:MAG: hypothetical protein J6S41_01395, partial [Clostridia bacterium]|nr:hypothetical protein [Clostridia bacterium]
MAAEYSANALQTVEATAPVIFTESPVRCNRGLIFHRDESGIFQLANNAPVSNGRCGCGCNGCRNIYETLYRVGFHANIAIADEGEVEPIQLTISINGEPDPSSIMRFTPAEVGDFGNVGAEIIVAVPSLCGCESISVRNISTQ